MNEKIKELVKQADEHADKLGLGGAEWCDAQLAKFAELIVQECVAVMSKTAKDANEKFTYMGDDVPTTVHQMKIKQHFGVEE